MNVVVCRFISLPQLASNLDICSAVLYLWLYINVLYSCSKFALPCTVPIPAHSVCYRCTPTPKLQPSTYRYVLKVDISTFLTVIIMLITAAHDDKKSEQATNSPHLCCRGDSRPSTTPLTRHACSSRSGGSGGCLSCCAARRAGAAWLRFLGQLHQVLQSDFSIKSLDSGLNPRHEGLRL